MARRIQYREFWRIVTLTGTGLPLGIAADGYDTQAAATAAAAAHVGTFRVEAYVRDIDLGEM